MGKNKVIEFNGKKYYLKGKERYYTSCYDVKHKKSGTRLHRDVWEFYSGQKIPKGYEIHHIDGNSLNNSFENLECLSIAEHRAKHKEASQEIWKRPEMREANKRGREKCKIWHGSDKGKEWHSQHQKETVAKNVIKKICTDCGAEFSTWKDKREQSLCKKCRDKYLKRELRRKAKENSI